MSLHAAVFCVSVNHPQLTWVGVSSQCEVAAARISSVLNPKMTVMCQLCHSDCAAEMLHGCNYVASVSQLTYNYSNPRCLGFPTACSHWLDVFWSLCDEAICKKSSTQWDMLVIEEAQDLIKSTVCHCSYLYFSLSYSLTSAWDFFCCQWKCRHRPLSKEKGLLQD